MTSRNKIKLTTKKLLLEETIYRCGHCNKSIEEETYNIAHVKPKCFGGSDDFENLIILCDGNKTNRKIGCHYKWDKHIVPILNCIKKGIKKYKGRVINKDQIKEANYWLDQLLESKKRWMFESGKYSKVELDLLFDLYQEKNCEWIVTDFFKDDAIFEDKNDEELAKSMCQVQKIFSEAEGVLEKVDLTKIDFSKVDIEKIVKNQNKRDHTKNIVAVSSQYIEDNGEKIKLAYKAKAIVIANIYKFLFRNIIDSDLVREKEIGGFMQMGNSFKLYPVYLIMTVKGKNFCEKFVKKSS